MRYFEIARGSVIEVDTAIDVAYRLTYINKEALQSLEALILNTFRILSSLIN
jgi:four helix bundle protein